MQEVRSNDCPTFILTFPSLTNFSFFSLELNAENQFRMQLVRTEQEISTFRSENAKLNEMLKLERNRTEIHERKIESMEYKMEELNRKLREREAMIKDLQTQNNQKQCTIRELEQENERVKRKYQSKFVAETEKTRGKLAREFKEREEALNVSVDASQKIDSIGCSMIFFSSVFHTGCSSIERSPTSSSSTHN